MMINSITGSIGPQFTMESIASGVQSPAASSASPPVTHLDHSLDGGHVIVPKFTMEQIEKADRHQTLDAYAQGGDALSSIKTELGKIEKSISLQHPGIKSKDWDFQFKDGKFNVTGSLDEASAKIVADKLNRNFNLTNSVKSFIGAAALNLQGSEETAGATLYNSYSHSWQRNNFQDVAKQLEGNMNFKDFINENRRVTNGGGGEQWTQPETYAMEAFNMLATKLTPGPQTQPVGWMVFTPAGNV